MATTNSDIYINLDRPRKLLFRHKDVSNVCAAAGRPLMELLRDQFVGWPLLLLAGLRFYSPEINPNLLSEMIDTFVQRRRADGVDLPMQEIGDKLGEALDAGGWIKLDRSTEPAGGEGNAPAPAMSPGA